MSFRERLAITTRGRSTIDLTRRVADVVSRSEVIDGMCNVFVQHTSASLILCENADPQVRVDLERFFARLVPDGDPIFDHTAEGDDDMPAHVRAVLTSNSLTVPVVRGQLALGTWQGIYLYEHRTHAHERQAIVSVWR